MQDSKAQAVATLSQWRNLCYQVKDLKHSIKVWMSIQKTYFLRGGKRTDVRHATAAENDLIEQADSSPKLTLDRPVLDFWDEFGNMPPIKDFDVLTSAARSRGVRFLLSLQDYGQLEKNYSKTLTKIIRGCIQMCQSYGIGGDKN